MSFVAPDDEETAKSCPIRFPMGFQCGLRCVAHSGLIPHDTDDLALNQQPIYKTICTIRNRLHQPFPVESLRMDVYSSLVVIVRIGNLDR